MVTQAGINALIFNIASVYANVTKELFEARIGLVFNVSWEAKRARSVRD